MAKESRWRTEARERIAIELGKLAEAKPGFTVRQAREHLSRAYPWGSRENWPYECWRQESKAALDVLAFARDDKGVAVNPSGVDCFNCASLGYPRCMLCVQHRSWLAGLGAERTAEWAALLAAAGGDEVANDALLDWLDENGAGLLGLAGQGLERVSKSVKEEG